MRTGAQATTGVNIKTIRTDKGYRMLEASLDWQKLAEQWVEIAARSTWGRIVRSNPLVAAKIMSAAIGYRAAREAT
jgi:hypothetical protein